MSYLEEAKHIWQTYVPKSGQSETVQGELLRAVEKLRDEAARNGNGNWDKGFEILLAYLTEKLSDPAVYEPAVIADTQRILTRLANFRVPYMQDEGYDVLCDRVVEYYRFYGSTVHTNNPELKR